MPVVTLLYYALVAFVSVILVVNLLKSKKWERDVLYVLVLHPVPPPAAAAQVR